MKKIAIIGAGGFGREVLEIILAINKVKPSYEIIGFYDDNDEAPATLNGFPFMGSVSQLNEYDEELYVALGIGNPVVKKKLIQSISNEQITYPVLIHPNAIIGEQDIKIGQGSIICAGCILTCNIQLDDFITLNLSCTVGHDTIIGDYASFMPSVNISGKVTIESQVYVGTGAKIINSLTIGEATIIGAGAVVSKTLPANCTAVGVPAKVIKIHE